MSRDPMVQHMRGQSRGQIRSRRHLYLHPPCVPACIAVKRRKRAKHTFYLRVPYGRQLRVGHIPPLTTPWTDSTACAQPVRVFRGTHTPIVLLGIYIHMAHPPLPNRRSCAPTPCSQKQNTALCAIIARSPQNGKEDTHRVSDDRHQNACLQTSDSILCAFTLTAPSADW